MSIELRPYPPSFFSDSNKNNGLIEVIKNEWIKYLDPRDLKLLSFTNRELYQIFFNFLPKLLIEKAGKLPADLKELYLNSPFYSFGMLWLIKNFREVKNPSVQNEILTSLTKKALTPDSSASYVMLCDPSKSYFYQALKEGIINWCEVENYSFPELELLCSEAGLDGLRYKIFDYDGFFKAIRRIREILNPIPGLRGEKGSFIISNFPAIAFQMIKNSFEPGLLKSLSFAQSLFILSPYAREYYEDAIDELYNLSDFELIDSLGNHEKSKAFLLRAVYRTTIPEEMIEIAFENLLNGLKEEKSISSIIRAISDKIRPVKQQDSSELPEYNPYTTPQNERRSKAGTFFVEVPSIIINSETSTTGFNSEDSDTESFNPNQVDFLSPQVSRKKEYPYPIEYFSQQQSDTTGKSSLSVTNDSRIIKVPSFKTPPPSRRNY